MSTIIQPRLSSGGYTSRLTLCPNDGNTRGEVIKPIINLVNALRSSMAVTSNVWHVSRGFCVDARSVRLTSSSQTLDSGISLSVDRQYNLGYGRLYSTSLILSQSSRPSHVKRCVSSPRSTTGLEHAVGETVGKRAIGSGGTGSWRTFRRGSARCDDRCGLRGLRCGSGNGRTGSGLGRS